MTRTLGRCLLAAMVVYGLASSVDVRRKAIAGVAEAVKLAAGAVASCLARENAGYDSERAGAAERLGALKESLRLATSDSEKAGLGRELADTEAEHLAIAVDQGNVVRTAHLMETAGDAIAGSFANHRGYAYASRATLRDVVTAERTRAQALQAELNEAQSLLAEATAAGGDTDKLSRAVSLIEEVNTKLASLRAGGR